MHALKIFLSLERTAQKSKKKQPTNYEPNESAQASVKLNITAKRLTYDRWLCDARIIENIHFDSVYLYEHHTVPEYSCYVCERARKRFRFAYTKTVSY